ncbi:fungal specific transcription factor [Alternaria alternata]|nr:fungal specific transcription factor [Alternaria alternata]
MLKGKRTINACLECQQRKRRCNGAQPHCSHCVKHRRNCVYTTRRRRGRGKAKKDDAPFVLQQKQDHLFTQQDDTPHDAIRESGGYDRVQSGEKAVVSERGSHIDDTTARLYQIADLTWSPWIDSETTRTLPTAARRFTVFAADVSRTMEHLQSQVSRGYYESRTYAQLPPKHLAIDVLRSVTESIQVHGIFLAREDIMKRVDEQYITGAGDYRSSPCRWATVCSLLGVSALQKIDNGSLTALSSTAWGFFKNAFAIYAEIAVREPSIACCEALLAMALFMLRSADTRVAGQITATAARVAHILGMHTTEYYAGLNNVEAYRSKRIFEVIYIINAEMTHRCDLPSPLGAVEIPVEFSRDEQYHSTSPERLDQITRLRERATLAIKQLRIHELLQNVVSRQFSKQESFGLLKPLLEIYDDLESWKDTLPTDKQVCDGMYGLEVPVALLHFIYLSCKGKVSTTIALLIDLKTCNSVLREDQLSSPENSLFNSRMPWMECAMAARKTLDVLFRLRSQQPFTHLWQILCYPLSAVLVLLSETLVRPASIYAEADAQLIHNFVQFLEQFQKAGCDVQRLLEGCRRLCNLASCAAIAAQSGEQVTMFGQSLEVSQKAINSRESRAISRFLASEYAEQGTALLPSFDDKKAWAHFEQWASVEQNNFDPFAREIFYQKMVRPMFGQPTEEPVLEKARNALSENLDMFNNILAKQDYMGGDVFSLIDIFYMPLLGKLFEVQEGDLFATRNNVQAWWERVSARDSWKKLVA